MSVGGLLAYEQFWGEIFVKFWDLKSLSPCKVIIIEFWVVDILMSNCESVNAYIKYTSGWTDYEYYPTPPGNSIWDTGVT